MNLGLMQNYLITTNYNVLQRPCIKRTPATPITRSISYLRALGVAVGFRHGITVRSAVLAVVGAVLRSPGLIVHGTIETLGDSVLGKDVSIEEYLEKINTKTKTQTNHKTRALSTYA